MPLHDRLLALQIQLKQFSAIDFDLPHIVHL